jgi:NTP pyrophosphatase (non-canonical NTP hydrolase)
MASTRAAKAYRRRQRRGPPKAAARRPKVLGITTFSQYQRVVDRTDEKKQRLVSLLGLVGEVGDLHSMMKKLMLQKENPTFRADLREEFGDVLWYLTSLAALYKISLEEIAQSNAKKAESLYLEGSIAQFDASYPPDERLPRQFRVTFLEKPAHAGVIVRITVNGVGIGDPLTDNAHEDDGYRYHDVFHLAYAAVLGWSPVVRNLLQRKRKSKKAIDEVEDGGRARVVEEAIAIFIFNQAADRGWYKDESAIDLGLLKTVRRLTNGLEVQSCTAKQWKRAIFQGFAAFTKLRDSNGGHIDVDLDRQSIAYAQNDSKDVRN